MWSSSSSTSYTHAPVSSSARITSTNIQTCLADAHTKCQVPTIISTFFLCVFVFFFLSSVFYVREWKELYSMLENESKKKNAHISSVLSKRVLFECRNRLFEIFNRDSVLFAPLFFSFLFLFNAFDPNMRYMRSISYSFRKRNETKRTKINVI